MSQSPKRENSQVKKPKFYECGLNDQDQCEAPLQCRQNRCVLVDANDQEIPWNSFYKNNRPVENNFRFYPKFFAEPDDPGTFYYLGTRNRHKMQSFNTKMDQIHNENRTGFMDYLDNRIQLLKRTPNVPVEDVDFADNVYEQYRVRKFNSLKRFHPSSDPRASDNGSRQRREEAIRNENQEDKRIPQHDIRPTTPLAALQPILSPPRSKFEQSFFQTGKSPLINLSSYLPAGHTFPVLGAVSRRSQQTILPQRTSSKGVVIFEPTLEKAKAAAKAHEHASISCVTLRWEPDEKLMEMKAADRYQTTYTNRVRRQLFDELGDILSVIDSLFPDIAQLFIMTPYYLNTTTATGMLGADTFPNWRFFSVWAKLTTLGLISLPDQISQNYGSQVVSAIPTQAYQKLSLHLQHLNISILGDEFSFAKFNNLQTLQIRGTPRTIELPQSSQHLQYVDIHVTISRLIKTKVAAKKNVRATRFVKNKERPSLILNSSLPENLVYFGFDGWPYVISEIVSELKPCLLVRYLRLSPWIEDEDELEHWIQVTSDLFPNTQYIDLSLSYISTVAWEQKYLLAALHHPNIRFVKLDLSFDFAKDRLLEMLVFLKRSRYAGLLQLNIQLKREQNLQQAYNKVMDMWNSISVSGQDEFEIYITVFVGVTASSFTGRSSDKHEQFLKRHFPETLRNQCASG